MTHTTVAGPAGLPTLASERLSDSSVREMFSNYDTLRPRHRKLVHLLHTELTKGELSDAAFMDTIAFITLLWRCFNRTACLQIAKLLDDHDELDGESTYHLYPTPSS